MNVSGVRSVSSVIGGYKAYHTSGVREFSQIRDFSAAQEKARSYAEAFQKNKSTVKALGKEASNFLKEYTGKMNGLNSAAGKLANGGANALLAPQGNVTEETVKNTVAAFRSAVDAYNEGRSLLQENADRGFGVQRQLGRMSDALAGAGDMAMAGLAQKEDGSLVLDEEKLTSALLAADDTQRGAIANVLGGPYGIASAMQKDARAGLSEPAAGLVANTLAKMQSVREEDPIRSFAQSVRGMGAYGLNNMAISGMLLNMLA